MKQCDFKETLFGLYKDKRKCSLQIKCKVCKFETEFLIIKILLLPWTFWVFVFIAYDRDGLIQCPSFESH